jgi:hypothetical protein
MSAIFNVFTGCPDFVSTGTGLFSSYAVTNGTSLFLFDADNTSLDELADVMSTLISAIKAAPSLFVLSGFIVVNVTTTKTYDADNTSLDELADVIGSLITSLQNGALDIYTIANALYRHVYDADNTSFDEIADVLASLIASLKGAGILL